MPVTQLPPERTWGSSIGQAFMNYMRGKQMKRQQGMAEQEFGIESALKQAQTQKATAEAGESESMQNVLQGLLGRKEGGIGGFGLEDYDVSIGPGGPSFQPKGKIPAETVQRIGTFKDLIATANEAKVIYDQQEKGKGMVGPIGATLGALRQKTGLFATAQETQFRMKIESLIRRAYAESGKQISIEEIKRLMKFTPHLSMPKVVFSAAMDNFTNELQRSISSTLDVARQAGYRIPKNLGKAPQKPTQQFSPEEIDAELRRRGAIK